MCSVLDDQGVSYFGVRNFQHVEFIIFVVSYKDRLAEITYCEVATVVADITK